MIDMPVMCASAYNAATYSLSNDFSQQTISNGSPNFTNTQVSWSPQAQTLLRATGFESTHESESTMPATTRRIIRVYIADKDENVPLEKSVLHTGKEELTDLTDQELYFGIPVKQLLDDHNTFRKTLRDKKASERAGKDVFLEPIKIRDLVMTVVTIASF
jgi:hypothetical protein